MELVVGVGSSDPDERDALGPEAEGEVSVLPAVPLVSLLEVRARSPTGPRSSRTRATRTARTRAPRLAAGHRPAAPAEQDEGGVAGASRNRPGRQRGFDARLQP